MANFSSVTVLGGQAATAQQYDSLRYDMVVNAGDYASATGVVGAMAISVDSQFTTGVGYTAGFVAKFKTLGNTSVATLAVNGLAAKTIKRPDGSDLVFGDLITGQVAEVIYDGNNFRIISPIGSKQIQKNFTTGEAINASAGPLAVYVKASDGKAYRTDATSSGEATGSFIGFAMNGENINSGDTILIQTIGVVAGFAGLVAGSRYYFTNTPGAIDVTPGTTIKVAGIAISTTELLLLQRIEPSAMTSGTILLSQSNSDVSTTSASYTKLKEIVCGRTGTYVIKFDLYSSGSDNVNGQIFKNGVAFGTERQNNTGNPGITYSQTLAFLEGDLIQIYAKKTVVSAAHIVNMSVGAGAYDGFTVNA